ncbi:7083_t:CDS:2, partial [Rhizophagus irregularis]
VRASIFFSPFKEHTLLVQCKNYITTKVGINEIREFEGALIRYNKDHTLGVFVKSIENGYTTPALLHA